MDQRFEEQHDVQLAATREIEAARVAARACLAVLEAREAAPRNEDRLLRPAVDSGEHALLRAARTSANPQYEDLLRPVDEQR